MMDKTININIGGNLFQIDEDAFRILRDYLQAINNRFRNVQEGLETIEDIESRIAEIFQSQKGLAGVISKENVEAMITIIGKPEDFDLGDQETDQPVYTSQKRRMYRNPGDLVISGVCGGIGAYLNVDPVVFRILFAVSALVFGTGFFIYLVLWIALPIAHTDTQKRELFGSSFHSSGARNRSGSNTYSGTSSNNTVYNGTSRAGNAISEIFSAIGKVCYIILRVFMIIMGVVFVLTGFLFILSFIMIFIFKYPGAFSTDVFDVSLAYFPSFLNYIVSPSVAPWIIALTAIAVTLPLLALIYWGVKMIFWFKARDGVLSLICLVVWVMSITALSLILFNEGISFAETAKSSSEKILTDIPDTLYIIAGSKLSDLKVDKELSIKEEGYSVFINEEEKELYIRPYLNINNSDGDDARIVVRKRSSGRSELDALRKTEGLSYNYSLNGDTLLLDEYFKISRDRKWAADNVGINIYVPEGTILKFDRETVKLFHHRHFNRYGNDYGSARWESGNRTFVLTEDGLKAASRTSR
ncbi:MAG: PspC domain-containing protein [Bacteroidales bacterium]|nr:PspC domain-containing protein [Bacteroidales bacterium]